MLLYGTLSFLYHVAISDKHPFVLQAAGLGGVAWRWSLMLGGRGGSAFVHQVNFEGFMMRFMLLNGGVVYVYFEGVQQTLSSKVSLTN